LTFVPNRSGSVFALAMNRQSFFQRREDIGVIRDESPVPPRPYRSSFRRTSRLLKP
jgi:hypothetical protein